MFIWAGHDPPDVDLYVYVLFTLLGPTYGEAKGQWSWIIGIFVPIADAISLSPLLPLQVSIQWIFSLV